MNNLIPIIYEDEHYVVFNKPAGLLVIPTPKNEKNTLVNIVNHQYALGMKVGHLHPCHRLDRETSGLIIFAKTKRAQQMMMELFKQRVVKKKYIAFTHGHLKKRQGEYKGAVVSLEEKRFRKGFEGEFGITRYKVLEERKAYSVVEVEPVTGRTNQIRVHFSEMGHPLLGDRKYSFARDYDLKFRRVALHAYQLGFVNPTSDKKIYAEVELPKDMGEFLVHNL